MKLYILFAVVLICSATASQAKADLEADIDKAQAALLEVLPLAEQLAAAGKLDDANAKILAIFPFSNRTPAEAFMLGNVLFPQDPKTSYELHKRAAAELPDERLAQLEWGMEQHRAKEYAAAAATYALVVKDSQDYAAVYGLMAECLLRIGKTQAAVDAFQLSGLDDRDTLEQFESWVCDVNDVTYPTRKRQQWFAKAQQGNIEAALQLVAFDIDFPRDWWNRGPDEEYLKQDVAMLRQLEFDDRPRLRQILCAADCALAENDAIAGLLQAAGLMVDDKKTLPQDGVILSSLLNSALEAGAFTRDESREEWGQMIRERAVASKDPELFNVACFLYADTDDAPAIEQASWDATADERSVIGLLLRAQEKESLTSDSELLQKARAMFPESSMIAGIVVDLAQQEERPLEQPLIEAIKAEYAHFSLQPGVVPRPGAAALRRYFSLLGQSVEQQP